MSTRIPNKEYGPGTNLAYSCEFENIVYVSQSFSKTEKPNRAGKAGQHTPQPVQQGEPWPAQPN